ncbi:MAG: hypothetical protein JNK48_13210 [Bryobacterales bacterium]|nr:hypothetical protein [Bryobacterales bacterium]
MAAVGVGCGYDRRFVSESPDGRAHVAATAPASLLAAYRVAFVQDGREHELYQQHGFEAFYWLEVYWDPSGERVGILTCSDPNLSIALDRRTLQRIPFATVEDGLRGQVKRKFGPDLGRSADWQAGLCFACCTPEAVRRRKTKGR